VTVEREGMTLLVGDAAAGFDTCPLCGNKLASAQTEEAFVFKRVRFRRRTYRLMVLPHRLERFGTNEIQDKLSTKN
jgi:hypothetical protein